LILIGLLLGIWEWSGGGLGNPSPWIDRVFLPRPSTTLIELGNYARGGLLMRDATTTLQAAGLGLFLGLSSGVLLGLGLGYWRAGRETVFPVLIGMYSLPRVALAPVMVVWFGLGLASKVFLSFFTVFFVIFFNTLQGVRAVDPELLKTSRVMGASRWQTTRMVVLPSVSAWIFAALPTCATFAVTGALVGEFIGSTQGLGYRMNIAAGVLNTERVFAILFVLMVISIVVIEIARRIERHVLRWRPPESVS
jgi:NitT/TauT family transport system permease protein